MSELLEVNGCIVRKIREAESDDGRSWIVVTRYGFGETCIKNDGSAKVITLDYALDRVTQDIYERADGYFKLGMSKQDIIKCITRAFVRFVFRDE